MGGFKVPVQAFGVYQAIDWLVRDDTSVENQIRATTRIREMQAKGQGDGDDVVKLNIVSPLTWRKPQVSGSR